MYPPRTDGQNAPVTRRHSKNAENAASGSISIAMML